MKFNKLIKSNIREDIVEGNVKKSKGCFETREIRKQENLLVFLRVCPGIQCRKHHLVPR
jgi:hypothetical protein